jgi:hypothetical protein
MAFCPNCGTPNTDQAEKCVACGFELAAPKQKPKFKGTIMMSGIKAPAGPGAAPSEAKAETPPATTALETTPKRELPTAEPAAAPPTTTGARNLSFEKTMLGRPAAGLTPAAPPAGAPAAPVETGPSESRTRFSSDYAQAPTVQQPAPASASLHQTGRTSSSESVGASFASATGQGEPSNAGYGRGYGDAPRPSFSGRTSDPRASESTQPPDGMKANPGKLLALGCAGVLALSCLVAGLLYAAFGDKLRALFGGGSEASAEAVAWQASISQSLAQVSALCQIDCQRAGVFFHQDAQAALLPQAKGLTPERVQKLSDPTQSEASMLNGTDDEGLASKLGLDPQLCARVIVAKAKVVSCSVPDPTGKPGVLRIVHLSGIDTL